MLSGKQALARELTASHEHYLRALWEVRTQRGYARLSDVARGLGVAPATLSVGLRPLEARGLVRHDEHRFLVLTPEGERIAREVHHRFTVVRAFLRDVLGIADGQALTEACLIEHDVSAGTTERLLDLIKLLREDQELREFFQHRFAEYHRACRADAQCSTCDLACLSGDAASRP
ncbi:MAG TPA: metal-dependent transcriptional regulator [Candidatus Limnocylindria bacterium]|nr:metal-dependent transcriptional regulator [Candidatus Limnocylindria bacterium]